MSCHLRHSIPRRGASFAASRIAPRALPSLRTPTRRTSGTHQKWYGRIQTRLGKFLASKNILQKVKTGKDARRKSGSGKHNRNRNPALFARAEEILEKKEGMSGHGATTRKIRLQLKKEDMRVRDTPVWRIISNDKNGMYTESWTGSILCADTGSHGRR